jgi:hypothetical protein
MTATPGSFCNIETPKRAGLPAFPGRQASLRVRGNRLIRAISSCAGTCFEPFLASGAGHVPQALELGQAIRRRVEIADDIVDIVLRQELDWNHVVI